ncbi:hypothetical protein ERO13_A06G116800v2 [Gossypium hirsutum]|uniref:ATP synthase subunit delta', mitochondrial n=5 Tax=Gossypium TaxID=3633 RepID=A0A1U8LQJ6_GOSHI|nr:ATP synthase subunit delta', mitochondrial [Gossypium hirsutum]KAB2077941.1 hypothetical protein ES319_A06G127700v1 [Gossypium barbadense]TYH13484.1 hypothetical protein ES288_A06G142500v1 [Gossypium darwinii]TYI23046.1 hypothetical protein ES332_A06G138400v1 [Gossypium tomentosum]TYJ30400.1 hypothetical protein E1A91_A06G127700v1 [Gossypium mustelinum]KAG4195569.1 hypothetical protein ERO13_A06G116800v2 [Gossypium hirsutum]
MLCRASRLVARRPFLAARARPFSTDLLAAPSADATFTEAWTKVIPNIDPPKTPPSFMQPRPPTPSSISSKPTVNFVLPYASELATKEVPTPKATKKSPIILKM